MAQGACAESGTAVIWAELGSLAVGRQSPSFQGSGHETNLNIPETFSDYHRGNHCVETSAYRWECEGVIQLIRICRRQCQRQKESDSMIGPTAAARCQWQKNRLHRVMITRPTTAATHSSFFIVSLTVDQCDPPVEGYRRRKALSRSYPRGSSVQ